MNYIRKSIFAAFFLSIASATAYAQSDAPTAESDPVLVFNRLCYAQVPVIRNIENMATRFAWERMGGDDLQQFTTIENPDLLLGWDARIAKRLYRLGVVQSGLTDSFKQAFPDFSEGVATGCTLVLDGRDQADVVLERMNVLARKQPDQVDVPDGELLTTTWSGGNEDFKVFLIFKSDTKGKANLLNVTILSKEST
ncbi:MAG: hypothetical protein AAF423_04480 [Pseudomonadota bacterium]